MIAGWGLKRKITLEFLETLENQLSFLNTIFYFDFKILFPPAASYFAVSIGYFFAAQYLNFGSSGFCSWPSCQFSLSLYLSGESCSSVTPATTLWLGIRKHLPLLKKWQMLPSSVFLVLTRSQVWIMFPQLPSIYLLQEGHSPCELNFPNITTVLFFF